MSYPDWKWWKKPPPSPGWVYCHGCGRTFQHIDGCPDCATDAYLEKEAP